MRVQARVTAYGRINNILWAYLIKEYAKRNDVTGWVRIKSPDVVELLLQGEREKVEALIKSMYRDTPHGRIINAKVTWEDNYNVKYSDFKILR